MQKKQKQLEDSGGTILRKLRDTLELDKINTLIQRLKEILSNLNDNVVKFGKTIDELTRLIDEAKELWNSMLDKVKSSLPKDTNTTAGDTAADQQAATSEEKMTLDLQNFLKNPDVTHLLNEGSLQEVIECHKLIDDFYEKTKAIKKILEIYTSNKIQVTLDNELQLVYNDYKVLRQQCRKFNEDADFKRSLAWVVLIRKEWKTDYMSTSRVYRRWSKRQSQFFEKIQKIKDECKLIHKSVTKFNDEITQEQLDGLVEALNKHVDDLPNAQEQQRQGQSSPDELQELREKFMNDPVVKEAAKTSFKSETMKGLVKLYNEITKSLAIISRKMDDLNLRDVAKDEDIDKMWENKYPQTKILHNFFDSQSYIRRFIAADLCADALHHIQIIYQACRNLTADKQFLK